MHAAVRRRLRRLCPLAWQANAWRAGEAGPAGAISLTARHRPWLRGSGKPGQFMSAHYCGFSYSQAMFQRARASGTGPP